jgi:hypothetical protein
MATAIYRQITTRETGDQGRFQSENSIFVALRLA